MKVTFKVEELKKRLAQLSSVVSKKAATPVYGYIRLYAVANGEVFSVGLTGADIDSKLNVWTGAQADGELDVLLPFARLTEIIANLGGDEVAFTVKDATKVTLTSGRYRAELKPYDITQWGSTGELERPETVTAELGLPGLKDQIAAVDFVVPSASGKFVVSVALLQSDGAQVQMIATDGFRLAISSVPQEKGTFKLLLPKTALELISKLEGGSVLRILETEAGFFFETDTETLTVNRTNGEFPPYERVLPKKSVTTLDVSGAALNGAVRLTKPLADPEKPVIAFVAKENDNTLALQAAHIDAGQGEGAFRNMAQDEIDAKVVGPAVDFSIDATLLLPFTEKTSGPIVINVVDSTTIVDFQANGGAYRYLIMPTTPANRTEEK